MIEVGRETVLCSQCRFEPPQDIGSHLRHAPAIAADEVMVMWMPMQFVLDASLPEIGSRDESNGGEQFQVTVDDGFVKERISAAHAFENLFRAEVPVAGGDDREDNFALRGPAIARGFDMGNEFGMARIHYCIWLQLQLVAIIRGWRRASNDEVALEVQSPALCRVLSVPREPGLDGGETVAMDVQCAELI